MKFRTVVEREGEKLGPIDWGFDFDNLGGITTVHEKPCRRMLREIEDLFLAGIEVRVCSFSFGRMLPLLDVGMYDGWPHWRAYPSFQTINLVFSVGEWHGYTWIGDYECPEFPEPVR